MHTNDLEALKLLKEWSVWLVTIETAAIGAIGAGIKDVAFAADCSVVAGLKCDLAARLVASGVIVCFGAAILAAVYLLLALPAVAQRLPPPVAEDIYAMRTASGFKLKLVVYVRIERWMSLAGFLLLAALILVVVWTRAPA